MSQKLPVLIVEDEPDLLEILVLTADACGYEAHGAASGREALEMLGRLPIRLILCDVNMPGMDGVAFLREVRARGGRAPFVFLTGEDSFEESGEASALGVTCYLKKPFDLGLVRQTFDRVLRPLDAA